MRTPLPHETLIQEPQKIGTVIKILIVTHSPEQQSVIQPLRDEP